MADTARARESALYDWLSRGRPAGCELERVENAIKRGTPDVFGVYNGTSFVVELKSVPRGPRDIWCELRSEQASFLRRWWRAGCQAHVLVQVGVAQAARRYLVPAEHCLPLLQRLSESTLEEYECHRPDEVIKIACHGRDN